MEIANGTASKGGGGGWWNFKPTVHATTSLPQKDAKLSKVAPLSEPEQSLDEEAAEVQPQTSPPANSSPTKMAIENIEKEKAQEMAKGVAEASTMEALKKMGEAGVLIEEIPVEQRLAFRMDFQVQPSLTDKGYWSMLKSHFAYWTNNDITAFILNTLYYEPEEERGKFAD